jgi:CHAD domain-containing protein
MNQTAGLTVSTEAPNALGSPEEAAVDEQREDFCGSDVDMPTKSTKWIEATRDELVFDVAERSLRSRLTAVYYYLPLAAKQAEDDVEYVHQLRVWTRRATAALRLYRDLIPWSRAGRVKKDLSLLRRAAGDARDDDVLLLRLQSDAEDVGATRLLARVRAHREAAQQPLLDIFDELDHGERFERRANKLMRRMRQRMKSDKLQDEKFVRWARRNLRPYVEQFLFDGQADLTDLSALHQFRISGKKLRYTMELLGGAFPPRFAKRLYPKVESLQDRLGEINDLATAQARFRHWLEEADDAAEVEYLKRVLADEQTRLDECCGAFAAWWTPQHVKRFAKAFDQLATSRKRRGRFAQVVTSDATDGGKTAESEV